MIITAIGLYHAQIVYPSVTVEIEVINHIPARVQNLFKLANRTALRKSCSNRIQVEIERPVVVVIRHCDGSYRRVLRRRRSHRGRIDCFDGRYRLYRRSYRVDPRPATGQTDRCQQ